VPQYQAYSATLFRDTISVMGFLGYYAKVLRVAFTHSLDIAQSIIFAFLIIIGVAPYLLQGFGVTLDLTRWATALTGWQVATGVFGTIILIRLILAPYWIHKELHQQIEPSGRKREIRIALANFMEEGQQLNRRCGEELLPAPEGDANTWAQRVEDFLSENLDASYVARFRDGSNLPMAATSIASIPHRNLWGGLRVRLARLQEFIRELSNVDRRSTSRDSRSENVEVFAIVVAERKLSNIERQIFAADFVIAAHDAAFNAPGGRCQGLPDAGPSWRCNLFVRLYRRGRHSRTWCL
jgi:hypothetical protein